MEFNATLIGEMIVFAFLIWFCVHFIWPHINKAIEDRQLKIAKGLDAAERAHTELKEADAKVADEIRRARQQATEIINQAQHQANQILVKARANAIAEFDRQKAQAQDDIASLVQQARDELRERVGALAMQAASKIVQKEIDPSAHPTLLNQLAAEI